MASARERLGWALVFSVPVAVGIALVTARQSGSGLLDPLVLSASLVAFLILFLLLYLAVDVDEGESSN